MKRYGYVRVSTVKQSIERQIRNIKAEYPDAVIVTDEYTGTKLDRPGWVKVYKTAKAGDVIVFDSVSRMSRDADEGFQVYEELFRRGVELIFLKEPHINTATYKEAIDGQVQIAINTGDDDADALVGGMIEVINRYMLSLAKKQIKLAFDQAEKEVEDLHQRTREGIETARLNGKQIGQVKGTKLTTKKSIKSKEIIMKRSKDFKGDLSDVEVMKLTGLARGTYYKYKREMKLEDSVVPYEISDGLWHTNIEAWTYLTQNPECARKLQKAFKEIERIDLDDQQLSKQAFRNRLKKRDELFDSLAEEILWMKNHN